MCQEYPFDFSQYDNDALCKHYKDVMDHTYLHAESVDDVYLTQLELEMHHRGLSFEMQTISDEAQVAHEADKWDWGRRCAQDDLLEDPREHGSDRDSDR